MTSGATARPAQPPEPRRGKSTLIHRLFRSRRLLIWGGLAGLLVVWASLLVAKWPFMQAVVLRSLQKELHEPVQIGVFHSTLFPPGYIAEGIRPAHTPPKPTTTTVTIHRLVVQANYSDLLFLRKNIEQISLSGLRLQIPSVPPTPRTQSSSRSTPPRFAQIRHVKIENAVVEFT